MCQRVITYQGEWEYNRNIFKEEITRELNVKSGVQGGQKKKIGKWNPFMPSNEKWTLKI